MAHYVICSVCGVKFNRDKVEAVLHGGARRYAHKACVEGAAANAANQEQQNKEALEEYIKKLFKTDKIETKVQKQITRFIKENHYTYSGMLKALIYFYEIKRGDLSKANGGIGIIEYVYDEARRYYYDIWEAQQQNRIKVIEDYKPKEVEFIIDPPKRVRKRGRLFRFLEDEEDD